MALIASRKRKLQTPEPSYIRLRAKGSAKRRSGWVRAINVDAPRAVSRRTRDRVIVIFETALLALLLGLSGYAMVTRDQALLAQAFNVVKVGLLYVAAWSLGKGLRFF